MDRRQAQDLDNYITGHYGEDQYRDEDQVEEDEPMDAKEHALNWAEGYERVTGIRPTWVDELRAEKDAAPQLLEALRPFADLGLWEDNYPPDSEEHAEAVASDSLLEVWVRPSRVRAARAAIKAAEEA